jgi:large subunit ribosomal protein L22
MKEYKSEVKFARISTQKARIPADIIRGMNAQESVTVLQYMPKKAAGIMKKVVESALANAEYANEKTDSFIIKEITVDQGPGYKRYKEGGRGSYKPFKRPTSHIKKL